MKKLNPEKLQVNFGAMTSETKLVIPRKYTLTHSDITEELFLTSAAKYDYDKITDKRDEVLAEWSMANDDYALMVYVMVDKEKNSVMAALRNDIFVKELPLAIEAIVYGDRELFKNNLFLYKAPIYVKFNSVYPVLNRLELWGTLSDYK
ncbi:staygreen family protein [Clostridium estertheticum]|uniref:staygreen family protein n=1 Tax=Clostridium estertheticum TaxID=238834 RepID=UPI0013E93DF1|nr:staygreen family protein [Clostridium estertheticum]MBZ9689679.1 staygreen family protein [Clostridium estertheticum]